MVDANDIRGGDIQLELGNWSQLHNDILMALAATNLSGLELRATLFLLRQTYGFKRKEHSIPLSEWCIALRTKSKGQIAKMLEGMVAKCVFTVNEGGSHGSRIYGFNKYVEDWKGVLEHDTGRADRFKKQSVPTVDTEHNDQSGITAEDALKVQSVPTVDTALGVYINKDKEDMQMPFSLIDDMTGEVVARFENMPAVPSVKARKPRAAKVVAEPSDHRAMVSEMARLCHKDLALSAAMIGAKVKTLIIAGYNLEDLKAFPSWWKMQWNSNAGTKPPTPGQVVDLIFQSREWHREHGVVKAMPSLVNPQVELMRRLKAEQAGEMKQ